MNRRRAIVAMCGLTLIVLLLAPVASSLPDGLETVARHLGFASDATKPLGAPLADYTFPRWTHSPIGTAVAGAVGALAVFAVVGLLGLALRGRQDATGERNVLHKRGQADAPERS